MSAPGAQVLSRRANGMPHADAIQSSETLTRNANGGEPSRRARTKTQDEGDKLIVRRLPPSMTEAEFVSILGLDWEVNKGKVDWLSYSPGRVSTDPSKPSRPSRAYLHLQRKDDIMSLSQAVRGATWEDAKSTFANPSLFGPPALEFSTYKKIPGSKRGTDPRQGTIDQDQEFMAFLESLANPVPLRESIDIEDADEASKEEAKVTTTPLVEFLKEKKANKGKDGGSGKGAKSASAKGKGGSKEDDSTKKRSRESKTDKPDKSDKASKETVKILTKKAATEQAAEAAKNAASQINAANAADAPKSRRAGIAAAARILQRDLGLSPGSAHRRARHDAAKAEADTKSPPSQEPTTSAGESTGTPAEAAAPQPPKSRPESPVAPKPQSSSRRTRGGKSAEKGKAAEAPATQPTAANPPVTIKKKGDTEGPQATAEGQSAAQQAPNGKSTTSSVVNAKGSGSKSASQKKPPAVTAGATRAFVKHANPSQGVTEAALRQALDAFGSTTLVEVEKRKGFAYVDFAEHESLVNAVAASPVQVAQTTVQVLERKDKKPAAAAGGGTSGSTTSEKGSGRGRRGRGGGGKTTGPTNGQAAAPAANTG
ncbi:Regulator of nonsense transcripts UPF3 [Tolypocladium ophioglossoides CBS 100239]|uniref:Regulator of nonsense transcripts UPF3 n=1 Tax=Tolypocladium ophioglossoides (strain CBS 100239) TaxID=1163406 RepID=A0A0L0NIU9_TOLOC|nr:Regulator of nonsense transcripts UPF3 [Tolypocladium ophioglossoides CBS 100239]